MSQNEIGDTGEGRARIPRHGDDPCADPPDGGQEAKELSGRSTVRKREEQIVPHHTPEVAMERLGRVQVERGRPRGGERRGELLRDEPALAHAGHNDPAPTGQDCLDRFGQRPADPLDQATHGLGFGKEHRAGAPDVGRPSQVEIPSGEPAVPHGPRL